MDAIPDISDTQVLIEVDWEGQDPINLLSVPRVKNVRGISIFTDIYWARSRILEYISGIELPEGAKVGSLCTPWWIERVSLTLRV